MLTLFNYNWQVRREWFKWCRSLPNEELKRQRTGGMGNILRTLAHIIDVECSWIRAIQGRPDVRSIWTLMIRSEKWRIYLTNITRRSWTI